MTRKIIHIDMDAFYASIEQRDNPDLKGKPVAVGGSSRRGVVAAASYEARKYGVRSALPSVTAKRLCPDLIFVKPRFDVYRSVSKEIREIFHEYTDLVEPLALDEAYLDVTENKKGMPSATIIAEEIKSKIKTQTKLTASAGVSFNKFLAKIASDQDKPDGLYVIEPKKAEQFVEQLPIEKFHGIGKVTAKKMHNMGIHTGKDLKLVQMDELIRNFGKVGKHYYHISRAVDEREVNPDRERKSVGAERTFQEDLHQNDEVLKSFNQIIDILHDRIIKAKTRGKTITLKLRYSDFETITRSKTVSFYLHNKKEIKKYGKELLDPLLPLKQGIRLLGLTISNLHKGTPKKEGQLRLDL